MSARSLGRGPVHFARVTFVLPGAGSGESCVGRSVTRRRRGPAEKEGAAAVASRAGGRVRPAEPASPEPGVPGAGAGARAPGVGVWPRALRAGLQRLLWRTGKAFLQGRRSPPAEPSCYPHRAFPLVPFGQSFPDALEGSAFFMAPVLHLTHMHTRIRLVCDRSCLVSFQEKLPPKLIFLNLHSLKFLVLWLETLILALRLASLFVAMRTTSF